MLPDKLPGGNNLQQMVTVVNDDRSSVAVQALTAVEKDLGVTS